MGKTGTNNTKGKKELYVLLDELPLSEINAVKRYLQYVVDKAQEERMMSVLKDATLDEEPLSEEDLKRIEETKAQVRKGDYVSFEQYLKKRKRK